MSPDEIEQAFRNLLDQAIKMHHKELKISKDIITLHPALGDSNEDQGEARSCKTCPAIIKAEYALTENMYIMRQVTSGTETDNSTRV